MRILKELSGAWEERGVVGTRIEIDRKELTVLWRNTPVLCTKYEPKETENGVVLELERNGLRYPDSGSDYATVTKISYSEGKLTFEEHFPITGPSATVLTKTENSRYGNYTVCDSVLKELQGKWKDQSGIFELEFCGDKLKIDSRTVITVHALHGNYDAANERIYLIADADPSRYELYGMTRLTYDGVTLTSQLIVCDAPPHTLIFTKKK